MKTILNVAVATDTITYAPFYLALYGGDFQRTPFGELDINIIARDGDPFFKTSSLPSKAVDGFVTLALFFGYADVGICDPSFIIHLKNTSSFEDTIKEPLKGFTNALKEKAKEEFYEANHNCFNTNGAPKYDKLKTHFEEFTIKVIGGMISKVAFAVVGHSDILSPDGFGNGHIGAPFSKSSNQINDFYRDNVKNVVSFPNPSTGYCVGKSLVNAQGVSDKSTIEKKYGEELEYILSLSGKDAKETVALTCDCVAVDHLKRVGYKGRKLKLLDDFVKNGGNAMFTGVVANYNSTDNHDAYKAFLYGIEKNLYFISKYLQEGTNYGLSIYFKKKLLNENNPRYSKDMRSIISFLVADPITEEELLKPQEEEVDETINNSSLSSNKKDNIEVIERNIEALIYSYTRRLFRWKEAGKYLYYTSTKANLDDLKEIFRIRMEGQQIYYNPKDITWDSYYDSDLLNTWYRKERKIAKKHDSWQWRTFTSEGVLLFFTSVFVTVESISLILKLAHPPALMHITEAQKIPFYILLAVFTVTLFLLVYLSHRYLKLVKYKDYVYDLNRKKYPNIAPKLVVWFKKIVRWFKCKIKGV